MSIATEDLYMVIVEDSITSCIIEDKYYKEYVLDDLNIHTKNLEPLNIERRK